MSIFSLADRGIKFNTAADIEPFLSTLREDVTEIRLSGNTFGVGASVALASALRDRRHLTVRPFLSPYSPPVVFLFFDTGDWGGEREHGIVRTNIDSMPGWQTSLRAD